MNHHWTADAVFYHIYALSFAQAPFNNDYNTQGHGFNEIRKWIPHIKSIGCNAVLLSPVLKAKTHGYDVTDYYTVDNRMGTNDDFRDFVSACHDNGIRVVLDSVFNHCGRDFFAFKELQNGNRDYGSWYHQVNFGETNPLGDPFTYDTWSGYYELPKFNLHNDAVRRYLIEVAEFLIDTFDIDGMRLDAANELDFRFMNELRIATAAKKQDFWLMGEVVHGDYARWVCPDLIHSVTNYIIYKSLYSSHNDNNLYELAHCQQQSVPNQGLPLYNFVDNHDQPRVASNIGNPEFLRTLYSLLFTLPGIPSIYYGSEWGIQGVKAHDSDGPLRPYIDIENPPNDVPWLEDYIRKLAGIRAGQNALKYGGYRQVYLEYRKPLVFERRYNDERIFVAINIGGEHEHINLSHESGGSFIDLLSGETTQHPTVPPYSSLILLALSVPEDTYKY